MWQRVVGSIPGEEETSGRCWGALEQGTEPKYEDRALRLAGNWLHLYVAGIGSSPLPVTPSRDKAIKTKKKYKPAAGSQIIQPQSFKPSPVSSI